MENNMVPQTSIHHLPLPPIPTDVEENDAEYEYTSELKVEVNRAYGTNLAANDAKNVAYDSNLTTEANRAYSLNITTEPNKAYEVNSATEVDQAYELDNYIDIIPSDSDMKTEENRAYGSKLSGEPNNEAAASEHSITAAHVHAPISTDEDIAYRQHNQLAEEGDMYEYI